MASLDKILVETRMDRGGSPAMARPDISLAPRPGARTPQLTPRMLQADLPRMPEDRVGAVMRPQAIKMFGDTLLDVAVKVRDRETRLKASKIANEHFDKLEEIRVGYLNMYDYDAIEAFEPMVTRVKELEKEYLENNVGHISQYLHPAILGQSNSLLRVMSDHKTAQSRAAEVVSRKNTISNLEKQVIRNFATTPVDETIKTIYEAFETIKFDDNLQRDQAVMDILGKATQTLANGVVLPGEKIPIEEVYKRRDVLKQKIEKMNKYVPAGQRVANSAILAETAIKINQEEIRRRQEEKRKKNEAEQTAYDNVLANAFYNNAIDMDNVDLLLGGGVITGSTAFRLKNMNEAMLEADARSRENIKEDMQLYADLIVDMRNGVRYEDIADRAISGMADGQLKPTTVKGLIHEAAGYRTQGANEVMQQLDRMGQLWILTGARDASGNLTAASVEEFARYAEFLEDARDRFNQMKLSGDFSESTLTRFRNDMELKYGLSRQIKNYSAVSIPKIDGSGFTLYNIENLEQLNKIQSDAIRDARAMEDPAAGERHITLVNSQLHPLRLLLNRQASLLPDADFYEKHPNRALPSIPTYPKRTVNELIMKSEGMIFSGSMLDAPKPDKVLPADDLDWSAPVTDVFKGVKGAAEWAISPLTRKRTSKEAIEERNRIKRVQKQRAEQRAKEKKQQETPSKILKDYMNEGWKRDEQKGAWEQEIIDRMERERKAAEINQMIMRGE